MACFALGLIVSLLRYRLYDAEAAISRSAGYALLTLLLGLTFAVSAKSLEYLVETYLGQEAGGLPGAVAAGLAVLLVTPLNDRVQDWAERRFQKDLLDAAPRPARMHGGPARDGRSRRAGRRGARPGLGRRARRARGDADRAGGGDARRGKAEVRDWAKQAAPDDAAESLDCKRERSALPDADTAAGAP